MKSATTSNKGGHSGNKHHKHHANAQGRPGTTRGTCVKAIQTLTAEERALCACGGCNARKLRRAA